MREILRAITWLLVLGQGFLVSSCWTAESKIALSPESYPCRFLISDMVSQKILIIETNGAAVISTFMHTPAKCRICKGHNMAAEDRVWAFPQPEPNPYQFEWDDLINTIRQDKPYNEVKRGTEASLVVLMGRKAVHTGQIVTFEEMLNDAHEFAPGLDKLTMDSPAPFQAASDGQCPQPQPGIKQREY